MHELITQVRSEKCSLQAAAILGESSLSPCLCSAQIGPWGTGCPKSVPETLGVQKQKHCLLSWRSDSLFMSTLCSVACLGPRPTLRCLGSSLLCSWERAPGFW